jgi:signal transduction histidine kinase
MFRPWQIWLAFGICLAVVVAAVGWLSFRALEADNAEAAARHQAALEENAQLALWRMDSAMAPLVVQESARPYFTYESFYSIGRPAATKGKSLADTRVPSPLLVECPPEVLLHFQIGPNDRFTSPRVPDAAIRARAIPRYLSAADAARAARLLDRVRSLIHPAELWASLPSLDASATGLNVAVANTTPANAATSNGAIVNSAQLELSQANQAAVVQQGVSQQAELQQEVPQQQPSDQQASSEQSVNQPNANGPASYAQNRAPPQDSRGAHEFQARSQYLAQNFQSLANTYNGNSTINGGTPHAGSLNGSSPRIDAAALDPSLAADARASVMKPLWIADQLVLVRRVRMNDQDYIQGCLLDWPAIQRQLLSTVQDLSPGAKLSAVGGTNVDEPAHMLASLPVRLEVGALPNAIAEGMSPVRMSLVGAWGAMILAALAVAALLQGVLSLSERRGAFVSAVTHELRTPLTTFRMYAEMLSDNMVPDETSRRHYLETLRVEADRLTHLVENVLLYARLERGRKGGRTAPIAVSEILEAAMGRLTDRARQANFEIANDSSDAVRESRVLADPAAVEQILFNLVDNACKYAAAATDRTLRLEVRQNGNHVDLLLRDHGPGIADEQRRVLFQPFRKSARDAANSAPGVGLGLALCRRLARDMGGDLSYAPDPAGGACFTLRLRTPRKEE